ncbi:MAG TPA: hypothetical protein DCZ92_14315 [Elusimicrobia bacterium]|nr:MAG: hypothetical protein A2016_08905 [Elusimicrobia bacterium GWF2_62_30]HBA61957.1 hypothetical protein [Elusimicrobiota bacterium]
MKIAFLTPSPTVLKHDWYRDLLWQKVGIPNLAGFLKRAGFPDITQYDFNNQICRAYEKTPGKVRLMLYADEASVAAFLGGKTKTPGAREISRQTAFFIDELGVKEHDLFGISLSHFLGDNREIDLGIRLAECLAKALKERFPGAKIMLGGMQNMSGQFQRDNYKKMLRDCPEIDYAVCGEAHAAMLELCRAVEAGREFRGTTQLNIEKAGAGLLIQGGITGKMDDAHSYYFAPRLAGEVKDPSVPFGFPAYDKANSRDFSYTGRRIREFYHLPPPLAREEKRFAPDNYLTLQVSFSEGCNFNCLFCSNAGSGVFALDLDESIRMLKIFRDELGCRHFLFYNPNFNPTYKYARAFLERIIKEKLDILWADCFNLRNMDGEMIALMREAGVIKVVAGVEYPTPRMLKYINKGITVDKINRNLEDLHKAGIWNHVLLITGMPTETAADIKELEAWLRDTKDLINAYTVGSFHMADGSPFSKDPEKFGFKLKDAMKLYCQTEFDEEGGLAWREKARQNELNNRHIRRYIDDLKGSQKPTASRMDDSHLLMYLYRVLGHGRKKEIERLYEDAYTVNPHIAESYAHLNSQVRLPSSGLNAALRRAGVSIELEGSTPENISFSLGKGAARLGCSVMARSEATLINPGDDRVHGDFFLLTSQETDMKDRYNRELAELLGSAGGRLVTEGSEPEKGRFTLRLDAKSGSARFVVSLRSRPPSCGYAVISGKPGRELLGRAADLLLASASAGSGAGSLAGDLTTVKRCLPEVLAAAESWPAAKKAIR